MKAGLRTLLLWLVAASALVIAGCGGGDASGTSATGSGTLRVSMTDNPACGFDHVWVTVNDVQVHTGASASANDPGWADVPVNPPERVDLLSLTNGVLFTLGQAPLPAGTYQQIRLILATNGSGAPANSVVPTGGSEQPLVTPSAAQTGIKIVRSFTVAPDTLSDLVLDFDACKSIVRRGNGTFGLKPVVTALPIVVSGSITGVAPAAPGAQVYAERDGVVVKATVADAGGAFTLSPIEQSSTAGDVDVVVVPTAATQRGTGIVRDVPVVAGASTVIATASAPLNLPASTFGAASGTVTPAAADAVVRALQSTGGATFEIAEIPAATDTGAYSLYATAPALPLAGPAVGAFKAPLPAGGILLAQDPAAAGVYTLQATSAGGAVQTSPQVTVTPAGVTQNFSF